eukprot:TRINITY_DN94479_c0_g1_i1.p1 TRINITY_DN94479_c0_g1~~TRINITY_DN94479_c0_g1_i1.p1  ORF type:complete len:277 (-),score=38.66 TRINITY_DN94479_c0_g1_i1:27-857(-)
MAVASDTWPGDDDSSRRLGRLRCPGPSSEPRQATLKQVIREIRRLVVLSETAEAVALMDSLLLGGDADVEKPVMDEELWLTIYKPVPTSSWKPRQMEAGSALRSVTTTPEAHPISKLGALGKAILPPVLRRAAGAAGATAATMEPEDDTPPLVPLLFRRFRRRRPGTSSSFSGVCPVMEIERPADAGLARAISSVNVNDVAQPTCIVNPPPLMRFSLYRGEEGEDHCRGAVVSPEGNIFDKLESRSLASPNVERLLDANDMLLDGDRSPGAVLDLT